jgi:hypothetical protein
LVITAKLGIQNNFFTDLRLQRNNSIIRRTALQVPMRCRKTPHFIQKLEIASSVTSERRMTASIKKAFQLIERPFLSLNTTS